MKQLLIYGATLHDRARDDAMDRATMQCALKPYARAATLPF